MNQDDPPHVGSVGQEAAKLFGALSDLAQGFDEHVATSAAECQWCPVCRTVHVLRQTSPEVRSQLTTAATSLLQGLSGLLATAVPPERGSGRGTGGGVQHIDLDDGLEDWPDDTTDSAATRTDPHTDTEETDR